MASPLLDRIRFIYTGNTSRLDKPSHETLRRLRLTLEVEFPSRRRVHDKRLDSQFVLQPLTEGSQLETPPAREPDHDEAANPSEQRDRPAQSAHRRHRESQLQGTLRSRGQINSHQSDMVRS